MMSDGEWCPDPEACHEDPEHIDVAVPGSGEDLDDPAGEDTGSEDIDWGDEWDSEDSGASDYDDGGGGGGGGGGYDDGPEPAPYEPDFDDAREEPEPPPPPADDSRFADFYTNEMERARRAARRALLEAWRRIARRELGPEGRSILHRWFPGATTDDLRQINRTILSAWHALGEADLRRVTLEYWNALPPRHPDRRQMGEDLGRLPNAEGELVADVQATTFWDGRPRSEYYTAVYPVFFLSPSVPYQGSTILHEGIHLVDPALITDTNDMGRINNAWAYTGFVSELTGMRFFRERALMCATMGCP